MAYPKRVIDRDGVYHVWTRATGGGYLCVDAEDRRRVVRLLRLALGRYNVRCHMYCVLGTHWHWVLRSPDANLGDCMRWLNGVYARTFNERHDRFGHLVASRYDAKLIDTDEYALRICSYIPLNPVIAGLCERPEQWPWSSYAATIGVAAVPSFLDTSWVLRQFGDDDEKARRVFRAYVEAGMPVRAVSPPRRWSRVVESSR